MCHRYLNYKAKCLQLEVETHLKCQSLNTNFLQSQQVNNYWFVLFYKFKLILQHDILTSACWKRRAAGLMFHKRNVLKWQI